MAATRKSPKVERLTSASIETERSQFTTLISINPNYFGNLVGSPHPVVKPQKSNTTYEEIGCVGFTPQNDELHATVVIKQPYGYGGGTCSNGSPEYVRFYTSLDNIHWTDEGVVSFTAYDVAAGTEGSKALDYAVTLKTDHTKWLCTNPQFLHVRAILSWNAIPTPNMPGYIPVWGEVQEASIQIAKKMLPVLKDIFEALKPELTPIPPDLLEKLGKFAELDQPLPAPPEKVLNVAELAQLYANTDVQPKRFLVPEMQKQLFSQKTSKFVMPGSILDVVPSLQIDADALVNAILNPGDGDPGYEELECVGLNNATSALVGVLRIKRTAGYSGGLCTAGSREYVSFWVDRDLNGNYTYIGTGSVNTYDFVNLPTGGLAYAVSIPIDLDKYRPQCDDPTIWRVRAILSWNVAPPSSNPNWVPVWGNREEALVYLDPARVPYNPQFYVPVLETVGGMAIPNIASSGYANGPAQTAGFTAIDSPFGGDVVVTGHLMNSTDISSGAAKLQYKLQVRQGTSGGWQTVDDKFYLTIVTENIILGTYSYSTVLQEAPIGWYDYQEDLIGPIHRRPAANVLAHWDTGSKSGLWQLQVVAKDTGGGLWYSEVVNVFLDNVAPTASVTITSGSGDCGDFFIGNPISGAYSVADQHLYYFRLSVTPSLGGQFTMPNPTPVTGSRMPLTRSYPTVSTLGESGNWTLDTTGMPRCGYNIWINVWDRTIVGSGYVGRHGSAVVGFCLREPNT